MRISSVLVLLVACSASPRAVAPTTRVQPPARHRDPAIAEPWKPPATDPQRRAVLFRRGPGGELVADTREEQIVHFRGRSGFERDLGVAESQFWDPCVRDYVAVQSDAARRALTAALARYPTSCDPEGRVVLQPARGVDGRGRGGQSDVGVMGTLSPSRVDLSLRVAYCVPGSAPVTRGRIAIVTQTARWSSPSLVFDRDEHGCDVAELPLTRALSRVVQSAIETADAVVELEGRTIEVPVTDDMKQDIRVMLDVLDAISRP